MQMLRDAGLRNTRARRAVLGVLSAVNHPVSQQEVATSLAGAGIDRVTLYRTLATLHQRGLVHRVRGLDGIWRFGVHSPQAARCGGNHIHFLCVECNQMRCLPEQPLPWIAEPEGAQIVGKQLLMYGLCASCNRP